MRSLLAVWLGFLQRTCLHRASGEVKKRAAALAWSRASRCRSKPSTIRRSANPSWRAWLRSNLSTQQRYRVTLQLATATTGEDVTQLTNMLFGNCSLARRCRARGRRISGLSCSNVSADRVRDRGIARARRRSGRPLTCTALKPQGSSPQTLAELCETFGRAGIDVIKDDHGIADQAYAPFAERVRACQSAAERASAATGKPVVYAPSLVGSPRRIFEQGRARARMRHSSGAARADADRSRDLRRVCCDVP